jgi:hypothetical protein
MRFWAARNWGKGAGSRGFADGSQNLTRRNSGRKARERGEGLWNQKDANRNNRGKKKLFHRPEGSWYRSGRVGITIPSKVRRQRTASQQPVIE